MANAPGQTIKATLSNIDKHKSHEIKENVCLPLLYTIPFTQSKKKICVCGLQTSPILNVLRTNFTGWFQLLFDRSTAKAPPLHARTSRAGAQMVRIRNWYGYCAFHFANLPARAALMRVYAFVYRIMRNELLFGILFCSAHNLMGAPVFGVVFGLIEFAHACIPGATDHL